MKAIEIREATVQDLPALAEMFDLHRQFYGQPSDRNLALRFLSNRFANKESLILAADAVPNGLIGFCQLYHQPLLLQRRPPTDPVAKL